MSKNVSDGIVKMGEGVAQTTTSGEPLIRALGILEVLMPMVPMVIATVTGQGVEAAGSYAGMTWRFKIGS